jgi:hypothetical protein
MPLFKIKQWDKHQVPKLTEEGEDIFVTKSDDDDWKKFYYFIETDEIRIKAFEEFVIFNSEGDAQVCVRIYFSDETYIIGRYSLEAWLNRYNTVYLPLIPKTIEDIVNDLKG